MGLQNEYTQNNMWVMEYKAMGQRDPDDTKTHRKTK
jgi:hypothetical protein